MSAALAYPALRFSKPVLMLQAPGDASRWFVLEKDGRILSFQNQADVVSSSTVLDITGRVNGAASESGLLSAAFDPAFATNGFVYVSYSAHGTAVPFVSTVSRFHSVDGGVTLDPASETKLISFDHPADHHFGGHLAFGPDGYLYVSFGDGGAPGNENTSEDLGVLLGKIVRLDVGSASPPRAYSLPKDNPFPSATGVAPEIYAFGFRNPWRFSFDRETGDLWVGDVGDSRWEEIDRVQSGGDYGWRTMEGNHCVLPGCSVAGLVGPAAEYGHNLGGCVIGGFVYRGARLPELRGTYVYADYVSQLVWALRHDPVSGKLIPQVLVASGRQFSSFAEGADGELYATAVSTGKLHSFGPGQDADAGTDRVPVTLSATGCTGAADPTSTVPGAIEYTINASAWADGLTTRRWLALPDGKSAEIGADGRWVLPPGAVVMKTFYSGTTRVYTEMLVRHDDLWAGYAYEWDDSQTEARLLPGARLKKVGGAAYYIPSRADCLGCHSTAAGHTLALENAQLDRDFAYASGRTANQVTTLQHIGVAVASGASPPLAASLASPLASGGRTLNERARSYLHANCAECHRPGGPQRGGLDLRFTTPLSATGVCDAPPADGSLMIDNARIVAPGAPARSVLLARVAASSAYRMPPLVTRAVDTEGVALLGDWIAGLAGCLE